MRNYRVRKIGLFVACSILAAMIYAVVNGCFIPADFTSYNKFVSKVQAVMSGHNKMPNSAEQLRQGISREVWYTKDSQQLQAFITAEEAEIVYEGVGSNLEIVENLKGVKGWMQDSLYNIDGANMQNVRYIEAESAIYRNSKQEISADKVLLADLRLPGHRLDRSEVKMEQAIMHGSADSMNVSLKEKSVQFHGNVEISYNHNNEAVEISADILTWNSKNGDCILQNNVLAVYPNQNMVLTTEKELQIKKEDNGKYNVFCLGKTVLTSETDDHDFTLVCNGKVSIDHDKRVIDLQNEASDDQLFLKDKMGKIYSDHALLEYKEINKKISPLKVVFTGNVSVINREPPLMQQALADRLTYSFLTKQVNFEANPTKRVLFYDQANNLKMSAKGLIMQRDQVTKKDSVKGIGDVRLRFDEQEFERLKKRFAVMEKS